MDGHLYDDKALGALVAQTLFLANRAEDFAWLREAVTNRRHVVLARYWPSAWVYGQLDGLPRDWLERVQAWLPAPQVCLLLDLPPDQALARRATRDGGERAPERYEGRLATVTRLRALYRQLWAAHAPWPTVDASLPFDDVVALCELACR